MSQPQDNPVQAPHFAPQNCAAGSPDDCAADSVECGGEDFQLPFFDAEAMHRIQVCVQACEGFSTADLEAGIIRQMQQTLMDVVPLLQGKRTSAEEKPAQSLFTIPPKVML